SVRSMKQFPVLRHASLGRGRDAFSPGCSCTTPRCLRPKPYPVSELPQDRFLFWRFERVTSSLSNVHDRLPRRHALRYPVSCCERSRPAGSAFAVNNHLRAARQPVDKFHELLKLIQCRRREVSHGDVVSHVTQRRRTCYVVPRWLFLLTQQRNDHTETIASQAFNIGFGWISSDDT